MCHVKLRDDGRAHQRSCSPHVLASVFICHDDPPHRRIKQQLDERNKQAAEPNEKKSCLQKHPPPSSSVGSGPIRLVDVEWSDQCCWMEVWGWWWSDAWCWWLMQQTLVQAFCLPAEDTELSWLLKAAVGVARMRIFCSLSTFCFPATDVLWDVSSVHK